MTKKSKCEHDFKTLVWCDLYFRACPNDKCFKCKDDACDCEYVSTRRKCGKCGQQRDDTGSPHKELHTRLAMIPKKKREPRIDLPGAPDIRRNKNKRRLHTKWLRPRL